MKPRNVIVIAAFVAAAALLPLIIVFSRTAYRMNTFYWNGTTIGESITRAQTIARALDQYHRDTKSFPGSLSALVPRYISQIPLPTTGNPEWRYVVDPKTGGWTLTFCANPSCYPRGWITSEDPEKWHIDQ